MICESCHQKILIKKPLTKNMTEVLTWISNYITKNNNLSPSYEEIKLGLGFKNKSEVARYIMSLQDRGHITKELYKTRTLQIL
mgnify:CR=1 FL=1|jgi:repressor LexA|tara:strand:+ start:1604 stop:1852 length:249 start_codon:yes stop_codon:yes gene_type:complete